MKTKIITTVVLLNSYMFLSGQIIHVPGDQPTIQAGIEASVNGDTVLVGQGTYFENINFLGKAITVASNYCFSSDTNDIINTVIDGSQPVNPDFGSVVTFDSGEDTTSILNGFKIIGGTGNHYASFNVRTGGGISCVSAGAKILNNIIENNTITTSVDGFGAGISQGPPGNNNYLVIKNNRIHNNNISAYGWALGGGMDIRCNAIIMNNTINSDSISSQTQWSGGGGIHCSGAGGGLKYVLIKDNHIINNTAFSSSSGLQGGYGGGIAIRDNYGNVSNNTITHNEVSAINTCYGSGVVIEYTFISLLFNNNIVAHNSFQSGECKGGGIYINQGNAKLQNNVIYSNQSTWGGGIFHEFSGNDTSYLFNNTITKNIADIFGGGIYISDAFSNINSTILFGDSALFSNEIFVNSGSISVNYSDIEGGYVGTGNISVNPFFENPENFDFHLKCNSPCIDTGDPNFPFDPDETICDIGAYYFDQTPVIALEATNVTGTSFCANWEECQNVTGYLLDVAFDEGFINYVEGFQNLDIGTILSFCVDGLSPLTDYYYRLRANYYFGRSGYSDTIYTFTSTTVNETINTSCQLNVFPNPVKSITTIEFSKLENGFVSISINNISGKQIELLVSDNLSIGKHEFKWNAEGLPAGIYFLKLEMDGKAKTNKIILMR